MPKVTPEHLEARRAQILNGARRAFAHYGYDGATVARLEEATGLSRGAIFHYFDGKKDLFAEVAADANRRYVGMMASEGLPKTLREIGNEDPEFLAVLIETESRLRRDEDFVRRLETLWEEQRPAVADWFRGQAESGAFRSDIDWSHLARFATMVINGLALRVAGGDETDIETVVQLLEDALRPQQPPA